MNTALPELGTPMRDELKRAFGADGIHWSCLDDKGEHKLARLAGEALSHGRLLGDTPRIVEIGTHRGVSACILARFGYVTTFDIKAWDQFEQIVDHFGATGRIERHIVANNADLANRLSALEFDFAFVDGCHDYEPVRQNFQAVRKCGRVLFHDYGHVNYKDRVVRAVDEIPDGRTVKLHPFALWESLEVAGYSEGWQP